MERLTSPTAPLPNFSAFHPAFRQAGEIATPEGDMRAAFFAAYDPRSCCYLQPDEIAARLATGHSVVSATFVTPYPPGFPVLVPGQCFSEEILDFMSSLDTPEVHGYRAALGYRVFTDDVIAGHRPAATGAATATADIPSENGSGLRPGTTTPVTTPVTTSH